MEDYFIITLVLFLLLYFWYICLQEDKHIASYVAQKKDRAFYCKFCKRLYLGHEKDTKCTCPWCCNENANLRF
jgi:hypothetical protein